MKKQLLTLVVMALAITGLTAQAAPTNNSSWKDQAGTAVVEKNNVFEITTPSQLAWVAQQVNATPSNSFAGKTVKLLNDIDLGAYFWQPIGGGNASAKGIAFQGTFDGNKKAIKGLYIDLTPQGSGDAIKFAGLFGSLGATGIIKDLGIVSGEVSDLGIGRAAFAGWNEGLIENCYNNISVGGTSYVGGIVGDNSGTIKACYNMGTIVAIAGGSGYTGGISGNGRAGEIIACYNAGTVKSMSPDGVLLGGITTAMKSAAKVTGCYNYGLIAFNPAATAPQPAGGLVGNAEKGTIAASFSDNVAAGVAALGIGANPAAQDVATDVLKNAETLAALNTAAGNLFKADDANLNEGYPVLVNNIPAATNPTPSAINAVWENSLAASKLPAYFNDNTRCLAYGNNHVYVVEGKLLKVIHIFDAATGAEIGVLNTDKVETTDVKFHLLDVEVSADGKIFAASMAMSAGQKFKVYMWANETAEAVKVLEFDCAASRIGDLFSVTGDYSKGTAKIYAATSTTPSIINVFSMKDGAFDPMPAIATSLTSIGEAGQGVQVSVAAKADGSMYWCAAQRRIMYIDANGTVSEKIFKIVNGNRTDLHCAIKYIGYNEEFNKDILAVFEYDYNPKIAENAAIISTTPGDLSTAKVIGRTTALGTAGNAGGTGDVSVSYDANNDPTIYVLSTNNGLGAYKVLGLNLKKEISGVEVARNESAISFFPNPATDMINFTQTAAKVSVFSIAGQLVKEETNVDNLNVNGLNGNYIMKITDQDGLVAIKRLIVK
ncbi:MAG: T9SS type A sorting domain-containing protein [Muribaculaceae bacterium]